MMIARREKRIRRIEKSREVTVKRIERVEKIIGEKRWYEDKKEDRKDRKSDREDRK